MAAVPILLLLMFALLAAPASAEIKPQSFQVPVTVPDETGATVTIDTDVYVPAGKRPKRGWPFIEVFHGGGSNKNSGFDAGHAKFFAEHGYLSLIYSQRGHGSSGGLTTVAGPNEMHDLFDVTDWAAKKFGADRRRIALTGYSQGGLNTNLAQAWASDKDINPYGIRFAALEPGNTPDYIADALIPNGVVKLSFGAGLIGTYYQGANGHVSPLLDKWIATASADGVRPDGENKCETEPHDTLTSSTLADMAVRSVGCFAKRMSPPVHWSQAFDDGLFTPDMAIAMWRRMPRRATNRLYLSMGGHAAPSAPDAIEKDKLRDQLAFFDHVLRGTPLRLPAVTYWVRDPQVQVPADAFKYPRKAFLRRTSPTWPPVGWAVQHYVLSGDGALTSAKSATTAALPLSGAQLDPGSDGVAQAAFSATPVGATPLAPGATGTSSPGVVAGFATPAFAATRELSGHSGLRLRWTPSVADTQIAVKLYDQAPDGTLTLMGRGVRGLRDATPGQERTLRLRTNDFSVLVRKGHSVLVTVTAGDASFYKPYPGSSAGGSLGAGPGSTLTLPVR
jgi:predicted acyl esterase